jgi:hypothetical protein
VPWQGQPSAPATERFWPKVEKTENCWLWQGWIDNGGYGVFRLSERKKIMAHRFAFEETFGAIPEGFVLDHLCRNRRCVNPAHLEAVTHRENIMRGTGFTATHGRQTHCHKGHELAGDNVGWRLVRFCRECQRDGWRRRDRERLRLRSSRAKGSP